MYSHVIQCFSFYYRAHPKTQLYSNSQNYPKLLQRSKTRLSLKCGNLRRQILSFGINSSQHYKYKTINAKAETVDKLPTFRHSFVKKRCLIPSTGFYEPDKLNFVKQPYPWHYFEMKDNSIFSFAGLYDVWKYKNNGKEIHSYSIITTVPNTIVGKYHDRMPVILDKEDEEVWLNPDIDEASHLLPLLKPFPDDKRKNGKLELQQEIQETII